MESSLFNPQRLAWTPPTGLQQPVQECISERLSTAGDYQTEAESCRVFDSLVEKHPGVFMNLKEVSGWYVHSQIDTEQKRPRIDRILVPRKPLVDAGWTLGPIGVECKKSGMKAGKAVAQAIDYTRAVFLLDVASRPRVMLQWIFLWPIETAYCDIASIMSQNRIGTVYTSQWDDLTFKSDATTVINVSRDGQVYVREPRSGRKTGSR